MNEMQDSLKVPVAPSLLIFDYWEKLAGASLALSAVIKLCHATSLSLVAPWVHSSLFVPSRGAATSAWPLSAYYDMHLLRQALAPQQLVPFTRWNSTLGNTWRLLVVVVVYRDFPSRCQRAIATQQNMAAQCPAACLEAPGVRRLLMAAQKYTGNSPQYVCVTGNEVRGTIEGSESGVRLTRLLREQAAAGRPAAMLNFRRHDDGHPMLAPNQAHALRARAVRPARSIRASARHFIEQQLGGATHYTAVQLRSNHVAHNLFERSRTDGTECPVRLAACVRRLSRAARRLSPPHATVVASDVATLLAPNQDGASHHRHAYMRSCLVPTLPSLKRSLGATGVAFNCTLCGRPARAVNGSKRLVAGGSTHPHVGLACDAGWLGLLDLVLASEAASFIALDVRTPWRSAFLEWILQIRSGAGRKSELITC